MELYIQIRDGQPFEHPIFADNFKEAFPNIDVNNLPPEFAKFKRVEQPKAGPFEVVFGPVYSLINGVVEDVWSVRPMTNDEEQAEREELARGLISSVALLKNIAQERLAVATTPEAVQALEAHIADLGNWVLADVLNPNIPVLPHITQDGRVLSTQVSGSAPDVIG